MKIKRVKGFVFLYFLVNLVNEALDEAIINRLKNG